MFKFKTPVNAVVPKLIQHSQFSCDIQNEHKRASIIKSDLKQNEIITDKFRKQLAYIIERNKNPIKNQPSEKQQTSSKAETVQEQSRSIGLQLANIVGTSPSTRLIPEIPVKVPLEKNLSEEGDHVSQKKVLNSSMKMSDLKKILPIRENHVPVLTGKAYCQIVSEKNQLTYQVDLSTAAVPLPLHSREKNLLIDSVVQDVNELNYKIGCWSLAIQNNSYVCYTELDKFFKRPASPQNFVREQALSKLSAFRETAIILCEAKESSTEKKPEKPVPAVESPVDKIKKTIENIISSLKQRFEEMKKKNEEAKKNEIKK